MAVHMKRVLKCSGCSRMTTESSVKGTLVAHNAKAGKKCASATPVKGGPVKYRTVVDMGRDPGTGKRIQKTLTADTQKELKSEIARLTVAKDDGTATVPSKMTMSELLTKWLDRMKGRVEEGTYAKYETMAGRITERLGALPVKELNPMHVEEFRDFMLTQGRVHGTRSTGLSVGFVDEMLTVLRRSLNYGMELKVIGSNPAKGEFTSIASTVRKQYEDENPKDEPWDENEVKRFLRGIREERLFACFLLSLMGLRPAEVCGLKWDAIDFETGVLSIHRTRTMVRSAKVIEKRTKTEAGKRQLLIPAPVLAGLASLRAVQEAEKVTAGEAYTDDGYVTANALGEPLTTQQYRRLAYRLMKATGLRKVRLYLARTATLTLLANAGVPDQVLADWAGHTTAATTRKHYVRKNPKTLQPAVDVLDQLLSLEA
jgi:integrase